ncbi:excinuclease ABC, A subunit [Alkaliphilus metalliredigens QYMF]|uniref:UvrABC system protein A n=1 Tax=Alkaliphilus metalliredigens (strain QYMF) TaxID=293826 RepID=A6TVI9_ALKMQ|nr:excinuclease ABC subunit UvrA [Alkaliphilus metalliredigens]ABR50207.1 excinuclease ABC, A subunit [Alkaliphilus metalliredigens QYMF]
MARDKIIIRGAKEHNLKNIDIEIPREKFVVMTGLSGSGKSSLAFDTIYAEGQRRYIESLSSYARQFLGQMEKPDVEYIEGLSPAISIDQKTTSKNPRSTVGTVTEIYDYLRLLFARVGTPHCPVCHVEISQMTVQQIVDKVMELEERTKIQILAPIVRGKKGTHQKTLEQIKKDGFVRVRINGEVREIYEEIELEKNKKHSIEVVVDRILVKPESQQRIADSVETVLKLSEGLVIIDVIDQEELLFSTKFACPEHGIGVEDLSPRMFSFNSPFGACTECNGIGHMKEVDPDLVIPNKKLTLRQGAIAPWWTSGGTNDNTYYFKMIENLAEQYGTNVDTPVDELPQEMVQDILYGSSKKVYFEYDSKYGGVRNYSGIFEGVLTNLTRRYKETNSEYMREKIEEYMAEHSCKSCKGARLKDEVLAVTLGDKNINDVTQLAIKECKAFFDQLQLDERKTFIGKQVLKEIQSRLNFLIDVGLDYLSLSRSSGTLSGGESQRIRLATQIGASLVGVLYILDEPSIGLHQRDNNRLLKTLRNLTDIGNTVIVVEHDEDTMFAADHVIDIGPGAGIHGGEVVAQGDINDIIKEPRSITGQYLSGKKFIEVPRERRTPNGKWVTVKGAKENNLKNINAKFPLGLFTCVTGVSGSGKSTLVNEILYKSVAQELNRAKDKPGAHKSIEGLEYIDKVIEIDQGPIGRTPRSNPATYTGVFDDIRDVFAQTPQSKMRGYLKGRFSFNLKGGRCEACKGDGIIKIEMHFLPDVYVPCEICKGKRYNRETLEVKYKGKTISEVLGMNVEEAVGFFENIPKIHKKLQTLYDVGLSYIKLGQPSTQLSGGEAQRIKLSSELSKRSTGKTLYILDEPTTGLHIADIHRLIGVLQRLAEGGNTILVIEHNLDVIKTADHIIDLGPEGGKGGGEIIAQGTPEEISENAKSYTGHYLKKALSSNH